MTYDVEENGEYIQNIGDKVARRRTVEAMKVSGTRTPEETITLFAYCYPVETARALATHRQNDEAMDCPVERQRIGREWMDRVVSDCQAIAYCGTGITKLAVGQHRATLAELSEVLSGAGSIGDSKNVNEDIASDDGDRDDDSSRSQSV